MKRSLSHYFFACFSGWLLVVFSVLNVAAQNFPQPMQPIRLVNDFAGILSAGENNQLENKLVAFADSTSTQISIVTIEDLQDMDISDYSARLFDNWGIGGKGKDNGILILVKPKTATSYGQVFISTGYGLEGAVPDALAGRIVDYDVLPSFRNGDYYGGLDKATSTLMGLTRGEFTAEEYLKRNEEGGIGPLLLSLLFLIFLFWLLGRVVRNQNKKGYTMTRDGGVLIPPIFPGNYRGGGRGGGFGGFSGGGGFGGFGGGMTGGGGAGGAW